MHDRHLGAILKAKRIQEAASRGNGAGFFIQVYGKCQSRDTDLNDCNGFWTFLEHDMAYKFAGEIPHGVVELIDIKQLPLFSI